MRKNHHGKKDRLVKRVFALCLALAVICTCLVPVFATEASSSLQVNQEVSRPVEDGEATYPDGNEAAYPEDEVAGFGEDFPAVEDGEAAGFGEDEAAGFGDEPREVYDDSEAAGFGEEEATRPVEGEGGESSSSEGGTVKDSEWGTVIEYGPSSSTETQWSGEDDVVEKPTDKEVVSGDQIKELQDMVVYRFWLKELNANDLQDIATHAQNDKMTESEYLARNGEVLWGLYFIQAVPRTETIADYSSYIENPSSNRDPKGELRLFDYWYTLDDLGHRVRLDLSDPTSNILDDKTTTVNVYAAWKDGTVGSDEEEKVDHEDLVDKNPVPVDLTAKASASYEDEEGELKTTTLPVEVKNLPSAAHSLSVIHMGDDDMESFYKSHSNDFRSMAPILGLKISPKNAKGETVQPANGQKATVTVSGLNELPEIAAMEEMGALNVDALKVLHKKDDGSVETLDVLSYQNGTLTFETSSFSPFVIALEYPDQGSEDFDDDGIEIVSIEIDGVEYPNVNDGISTISSVLGDENVPVGATIKLRAKNGNDKYYHYWEVMQESTGQATLIYTGTGKDIGKNNTINVKGPAGKEIFVKLDKAGKVVIRHTYGYSSEPKKNSNHDTKNITVVKSNSTGTYNLYVYTQVPGFADDNYNDEKYHNSVWNGMSIGKISGVTAPSEANAGLVYSSTQISNKLGKEIVVDSGQFPVIPILQEDKKTYVDYYYETDPRKPDNAPYYTIDWYRVVVSSGANTGKNGTDGKWEPEELKNTYTKGDYASPITPVNGNQYHLDGILHFHDDVHINVNFKVQDAGKTGFELEPDYTAIYKTDKDKNNRVSLQNARRPDTHSKDGNTWVKTPKYPKTVTKVENGITYTYTFDGWYRDKDCKGKPFDFDNDTITEDTTFYAKYVKESAETSVTITKRVTGIMGDTNKEFGFSVKVENGGTDVTSAVTATYENGSTVDLNSFTLKHNQTITLTGVPVGATVTVKEFAPGKSYTVKATGYEDGQSGENDVIFYYTVVARPSTDEATVVSEDEEPAVRTVVAAVEASDIIVINHCTLFPDTGVLLDTLPYIVILAVVAGGVALLMLRKRRKEDD